MLQDTPPDCISPVAAASLASVLASHGGRLIQGGKPVSLSDCNAGEDLSEAICAGWQG